MTLVAEQPFEYKSGGDGTIVEFEFEFTADRADEILVYVEDDDPNSDTYGVRELKTIADDYTVTFYANKRGKVTFTAPVTTLKKVFLRRNTAQTQEVDYVEGDSFPANSHESALDKVTRQQQEQQITISSCLRFPEFEVGQFNPEIPKKEIRANRMFGFDADGKISMVDLITQDVLDSIAADAALCVQSAASASGSAQASQEAQMASENAQAAAESARDTALATISSAGDSELSQIEAEGDNQVNRIQLAATLNDRKAIVDDAMNQLISGSMVGSEGAWKIIDVTTVTPDTIQITSRDYGDITLIYNSTFTSGTSYGNNSVLRESFSAVIIGDSGTAYLCPVVQYGSGETTLRYADIHPKYGDVRADFTAGNIYTVVVCQEDTDNPVTGTLERTEFVIGGVENNVYVHQVQTTGEGWAGDNGELTAPSGFTATTNVYYLEYSIDATNINSGSVTVRFTNNGPLSITSVEMTNTEEASVTVDVAVGDTATVSFTPTITTGLMDLRFRDGESNLKSIQIEFLGDLVTKSTEEIYAALNAPAFDTEVAPDPTFTQDGSAGGWSTAGAAVISGGTCSFNSARWASVHKTGLTPVNGKKYLCKVVVDSISTGVINVQVYADANDGTTDENRSPDIDAVGTHYSVVEMDADSTSIKLIALALGGSDAVVSEFSIKELGDTPLTNIAPDPYFEQDGTAGGWGLSQGATISGGVVDWAVASQWASVYKLGDYVEGTRYLVKYTINSITTGGLRAYCVPASSDGTNAENYGTVVYAAGTYYDIVETDDDSTVIGLQTISSTCDAVVSELSIYPIDDIPGAINAGYWDGTTWQCQLLGDASYSGGYLRLTADREMDSAPSAVYVLNASAEFVACSYTGQVGSTQLSFYWSEANNQVFVNVAASYAALGYASEADMLANSAVKVEYTHAARRVRPCANPTGVKVSGEFAWYLNDANAVNGAALVSELLGTVPVGTASKVLQAAVKSRSFFPSTESLSGATGHETVALDSSGPIGIKFEYGGIDNGSTWDLFLRGKELIYDPDWGDDGEIPAGDYVTTTTDDNGNVVIRGCWKVDTGVPSTPA